MADELRGEHGLVARPAAPAAGRAAPLPAAPVTVAMPPLPPPPAYAMRPPPSWLRRRRVT